MFHLFTHIHHDGKRLLSESEVLVKYDAGPVLYQDRAMKQITFAPRNPPAHQYQYLDARQPVLVFDVRLLGRRLPARPLSV